MDLLIKNWSKADWEELLEWAKFGANNAMIGEFTEVVELPPHGRLIDADAITFECNKARLRPGEAFATLSYIESKPTIIPASEEDEE